MQPRLTLSSHYCCHGCVRTTRTAAALGLAVKVGAQSHCAVCRGVCVPCPSGIAYRAVSVATRSNGAGTPPRQTVPDAYGTPSPASYSLLSALDNTLVTDSYVVNKRSPDERDYSQSTGVVFGVVSVVTSEYMWMPRALVVVCVIALIIVSCLVGLYLAGILRRRRMLPQGGRNVLGLGTGCPGGYEPGCQQVAIGTPVAYYSAAPTWQYAAPNTYGAQQGYSGQPWAAQQHGYPAYPYAQGTVPKQVGPLYPV